MRIISKRKGQRPAQSTISRAVAMSVEAMESRLLMSVSYAGGTYTQNFDTLVTTGTAQPWTNDTTLAGWSLFRQPAPGTAIPTINAGDGTSNAGSFYSFGTGTTAERALGGAASGGAYFGSPASGAVAGWMALAINNGTSSSIPTFNLNYDGEQWRNGGNATAQTMSVEYGFGSAFTDVTTWNPAGTAFDFASPIHTATASALDGNAAANRQANLGGTIAPAGGWAPGSTLWFRWIENNDAGSDHGLALDNVAFSVPVTPVESFTTTGGANIDNAAGGAANEVLNTDGSITLTVTRTASDSNLSNTASVAYTTADGTGVAGTDYTATSGTLTFAAGETVKTINIPVLTRSTPSGDHTFALNLTPTVASGRSALAPSYTVEVEDTRPALVNVAQAEALSSGTVATITSNPVITKILSVGGSSVNGLTYASWSFTVDDGTGSAVIFGPLPAGFTPVVGNTISVTGTWSRHRGCPGRAGSDR